MNRNEVYDRSGGYDVPRSLGNNYYVNVPPQNVRPSYMNLDLSRGRCPSFGNGSRKQRSFDDTESCYYSHYVNYENTYEKVKDEPFYQNGGRRLDVIGHGIGRIERHLSSSCNNIDHYNVGTGNYAVMGQTHVHMNNPSGFQSQNQKNFLEKSRIFGCLGGDSQSMNNLNGNEQEPGTRGNFVQPSSLQGQASARYTGAIPKSRNKVAPKPSSLPQQPAQPQNPVNKISKSSLQYLLINKFIPLFIGGSGPDYKIIDFNFMFNRNERNQGLVRFNGEAEYNSFAPSTSREYPTLGNYPRVIRNTERMSHLKECEGEVNPENPDYRGVGPSRARSESPHQMQNGGENDPFRNWSFNFENNSFRPARQMQDYQDQNSQKEQDMEFGPQINIFEPQPSSSKSSSPTDSENSAYSIASMRSGATEMKKSDNYDNLASLQEALPTENISNESLTIDDGDDISDCNEFQLEID
jgi:kelch-like protein 2/3